MTSRWSYLFSLKIDRFWEKMVAEITGTFFMTAIIANTGFSITGAITMAYFVPNLVLMMFRASGSHFSAVATVQTVFMGHMSIWEGFVYICFQMIGSMLGGLYASCLEDHISFPQSSSDYSRGSVFMTEVIFTSIIFFAANCVNMAPENINYFSCMFMAITGGICCAVTSAARISGAGFNPSVAMLSIHENVYRDLPIYWTAPICGGIFAAILQYFVYPSSLPNCAFFPRKFAKFWTEARLFNHPLTLISMEIIGSFYITMAVAFQARGEPLAPFGISAGMCCLKYAGESASGAHINPCISFGMYLKSCATAAAMNWRRRKSKKMMTMENSESDFEPSKAQNVERNQNSVRETDVLLGDTLFSRIVHVFDKNRLKSPGSSNSNKYHDTSEIELVNSTQDSSTMPTDGFRRGVLRLVHDIEVDDCFHVYSVSRLQNSVYRDIFDFKQSAIQCDSWEGFYYRTQSLLVYVSCQFIGAIIASFTALAILGRSSVMGFPRINKEYSYGQAFLAEYIGSMILVVTFISFAVARPSKINHCFGLLVGFILGTLIQAVGDVSGGSFNPSYGVALSLVVGTEEDHEAAWVYFFAPMAGAVSAVILFCYLYPDKIGLSGDLGDGELHQLLPVRLSVRNLRMSESERPSIEEVFAAKL